MCVDVYRMYRELVHALGEIGFSGDEFKSMHSIIAAILTMGNISFDAVYGDVDPANISSRPEVLRYGIPLAPTSPLSPLSPSQQRITVMSPPSQRKCPPRW